MGLASDGATSLIRGDRAHERRRDDAAPRFRLLPAPKPQPAAAPTTVLGASEMIDPSRAPVPIPVDGEDSTEASADRDEVSMRLVEWAMALVAIAAAILLALR
jgi:hypothetical protein